MKTYIMIPTYNESKNIGRLISEILELNIKDLDIVVVDDNSPDKTWQIVEKICKKRKNVHLLLRKKNKGRGFAGVAGFQYCLGMGADYIIEMDADFSHNPKYIPELLREIKHYDVVIGSRFVKGAKDVGRGFARTTITKLANLYIRLILGLSIKDPNSGYRCFRRNVLEKINLDKVKAGNADIVQEIIYKCHKKGFKIKEIPIIFKDRKAGKTTKTPIDFLRGLAVVLRLRLGL